jgi:hypothetical protein
MFSLRRTILLLSLTALVCASTAMAGVWPSGTFQHVVKHDQYGDIGTHTVTFKHNGNRLIVKTRTRIKVQVLLWGYHFEADRKEVWHDGRLIAYEGFTNEDGEIFTVRAQADGNKLMINGPAGRIEVPGTIFPTHPCNPETLEHDLLMNTKTGELKKVKITAVGEEPVKAGGRHIKARKYLMSGDLQRELWYDQNGICVQVRFSKGGDHVTLTLRSASGSGHSIRDLRLIQ